MTGPADSIMARFQVKRKDLSLRQKARTSPAKGQACAFINFLRRTHEGPTRRTVCLKAAPQGLSSPTPGEVLQTHNPLEDTQTPFHTITLSSLNHHLNFMSTPMCRQPQIRCLVCVFHMDDVIL